MVNLVNLLSEREREVFELLASVETNADIADQLIISTNTVKYHLKNIYTKLGVDSRAEAIHLAQQTVRQAAAAGSLPRRLDRFIGRTTELAAIRRLIEVDEKRLITICGIGGVGKTRLAIEVTHQLQSSYPDGATFVNLIQHRSLEALLTSLHQAVGFIHNPQNPAIGDATLDFFREKSMLLVLDNFDGVLEASPFLLDLLEQCPAVDVLITSRERLGVQAETVYRLEGMTAHSHAVDLFINTAARIDPNLHVSDEEQAAIRAICAYADGLPLAIVLAASWVSMLPVSEILGEIRSDITLLETDYPDLPARHRSLVDLFTRQWRRLDEHLRQLTTKLTVFAGGFTREAAQAIAEASLLSLRQLVEISFLTVDPVANVYYFHPLIQQFIESYHVTDDLESTRAQHSRYYLKLLMQAPTDQTDVSRLNAAFENVLAGWQWAERTDLAGDYLQGILRYGRVQGWSRFGKAERDRLESILARALRRSQDAIAGLTYLCLARMHQFYGESAQAMACIKAALALDALPADIRGRLHYLRSQVLAGRRAFDEALAALDMAEQHLGQPEGRWQLWIDIQLHRCNIYYWQNDLQQLAGVIGRVQPLVKAYGTILQRAELWHQRSTLDFRLHGSLSSPEALQYSQQSLALCVEFGSPQWIMQRTFSVGFIYLWAGHLTEAEDYLLRAVEVGEALGSRSYLRYPYVYLSILYRFRHDWRRVEAYTARITEHARENLDTIYLGIAAANRAWLAARRSDWHPCLEAGEEALTRWAETAYPMQWLACFPLIEACAALGQLEQARRYITRVLADDQQQLPPTTNALLQKTLSANSLKQLADHLHHYTPERLII